jgi:GT2 family glycosyltransferase
VHVSFIIISYNTRELTRTALRSVYEQTRGVEFTVWAVDNASTDGSAEMIAALFPAVQLIRSPANLGFGKATNRALREIRSKYVFLLNPDALLLNNAAKIFFDFMERPENRKVGACGGALYYEGLTPQPSFGNFPSAAGVLFEQALLHKLFRGFYNRRLTTGVKEHPRAVTRVDYLSGAGLFLRKEALDAAGFFDEDFFLYFEETELSYRFFRCGYASCFIPDAKILHLRRQSTAAEDPLGNWARYKKSEFMFYRKCHGAIGLTLVKSIYLFSFIIRLLLKQDPRYWQYAKIVLADSRKPKKSLGKSMGAAVN